MGRGRPAGSKDKTPRKRRGKVVKVDKVEGCNCAEGCTEGCKDAKVVAPEVK